MLQRSLKKFDKIVFLRKRFYRNSLIMCIVVPETCRQKNEYGLLINDLLSFTLYLLEIDKIQITQRTYFETSF